MQLSPVGLAAIQTYEGLRLEAYQDSAGVWTIGYGHTGRRTPPLASEGMTCTVEEAEALFEADAQDFAGAVDALTCHQLETTQGQFDAMVSLAYNIGLGDLDTRQGGFVGSTVLRQHLAGFYEHAGDAFLLWNKAGGVINEGLVARREKERATYIAGSPAPTTEA